MAAVLLRHAKARTSAGDGGDLARTLDREGMEQAIVLASVLTEVLAHDMPLRIITSPALRCEATVAPLGERFGVACEEDSRLVERASDEELAELADLAHAAAGSFVLCGHAPSLGRLARLMLSSQAMSIAPSELQLGLASFLRFDFAVGSGRRLTSLARYGAPHYRHVDLIG
ncbi:histidine phosphatase family protein [Ferrimicrobium sp.]|uniref:SixA phosphatase family protein n=1 Tax=Ferrimicrobium sp. TaxID=2926050 RepID=UPI002606A23E|nr:histidine phosphatase family protein [Ferrimicrobium sp.]